MKLIRPLAAAAFVAALAAPAVPAAAQVIQERVDLAIVQRIRDEALNHSQADSVLLYLSDVIGPRLTGSPQILQANNWTAQKLREWGLQNVVVEPWDSLFGRAWERVSYAGRILTPFVQPLNATPQAWSGSTRDERGRPATVTCNVLRLQIADTADYAQYAGRLRGACVMWQAPPPAVPEFEPSPRRLSLDDLFAPPAPPRERTAPTPEEQAARVRQRAMSGRMAAWLRTQGPAAILTPSGWQYNILRTGAHLDGRLARDSVYEPSVHLLVSLEHYGQIWRNVARGQAVRLELNVQNRFPESDRRAFNTVGDLPGTDKANEYVILGGHIDSWHSGTGTGDDAVGVTVMMEAARILKTLNLPLRRTVRLGFWAGEEQGFLGSRAYVRTHAAELPRVSAYLNIDNGNGRIRGIYNQMNSAVTPIFEQILFPFRDLGVMTVKNENTGGTDHIPFDAAGVPGFQFVQDPLEYGIRLHHSNGDTWERVVPDDLHQMAAVVAWMAYELANREELLPRKAPRAAAQGGAPRE
jgi:carboxypeptidase Q